ncbi:MAG TPA: head-tail adaptor protein [Caulobacterales bacterium]|nr:head-tail adaptor protein [Caulobacterales bacterium]
MPRQTPTLNDRVRIERRFEAAGDVYGNPLTDWAVVPGCNKLRAAITEFVLGAGETVLAAKLEGHALQEVWLRSSSITRAITPNDRLIDLANDGVLNIRHVKQPARADTHIRLIVERGVAT